MAEESNKARTPSPTTSSNNLENASASISSIHSNIQTSLNILPPRTFKVIVLGNSSVGKTCLTYRFCQRNFLIQTEATIGVDFRERLLELSDRNTTVTRKIKLQLWDTAGQERYRTSMVPHYYRNAHAVVFVYDVTRPQTFTDLEGWIRECDQYLDANNENGDIPRCVVGNKIDLIPQLSSTDSYVPTELAQRFSDIHNMPLFETSAKENNQMDNVDAIFITLAHKLKDSKPFISRKLENENQMLGINLNGTEVEVGNTGMYGCC